MHKINIVLIGNLEGRLFKNIQLVIFKKYLKWEMI